MKTNIGLHCHVENVAVCGSNEPITVALGFGSTDDRISGARSVAPETLHERQIPGVTLNELIERHFGSSTIDICKIDIEGAENHLFLEAPDTSERLLRQARFVIIEIHEEPTYDRMIQRFRELGFDLLGREEHSHLGVHLFRNSALKSSSIGHTVSASSVDGSDDGLDTGSPPSHV